MTCIPVCKHIFLYRLRKSATTVIRMNLTRIGHSLIMKVLFNLNFDVDIAFSLNAALQHLNLFLLGKSLSIYSHISTL